jgi:stage V sporulation protein D (sporulation-specific penicillin-binding protein)
VAKPFTVAAGIDSGAITGNEVYNCDGDLVVGDKTIKCHNIYGDGLVSVERSIEISCNVALMQIGQVLGPEQFTRYQHAFGFGLKTNVDLYGEARTANLIYPLDKMGPTELATGTFGQGFNVTMIETIAGFCSLINGGYYYQPHLVSEIVSPSGGTVRRIQPRLIRQTISQSTSDKIVQYCNSVVSGEEGTGKTARPAGYMIGGKTGTAETIPRDKINYVVSFMGYAPADDPQIAIYVVVDRPNTEHQPDAKYATRIVRAVLTETLPYLHYPMTEELTDEERAELENMGSAQAKGVEESALGASGDNSTEGSSEMPDGVKAASGDAGEGSSAEPAPGAAIGASAVPVDASAASSGRIWETFDVDPETGYYIDPNTGALIDPETGDQIGGESDLPDKIAGDGEKTEENDSRGD